MNIKKITHLYFILIFTPFYLAYAEISTDTSLGGAFSAHEQHTLIPDILGQQRGQNLFHSFAIFSINEGQSVTFTGANNIQNIITRVTGGQPSIINGRLASTIPNADFYLINPYGITLGKHAELDIQGIFHASVADGLSFEDETYFSVTQAKSPLLTTASPIAFGFFDPPLPQPAEINIHTDIKNSTFYAPLGKINLEADNLSVQDSFLFTLGGSINVRTPGTFDLSLSSLDAIPNSLKQHFDIVGNLAAKNGYISVQAKNFFMSKGILVMDNVSQQQSSPINIQVDNIVKLTEGVSIISRNYVDDALGADINITAQEFILEGFNEEARMENNPFNELSTIVTGNLFNSGQAGNISIHASDFLMDHALVQTYLFRGLSGDIYIESNNIKLKNNAVINIGNLETDNRFETEQTQGTNQAGNIDLIGQNLVLEDSFISNSIPAKITANAGNISIESNFIGLNNSEITSFNQSLGKAGTIKIDSVMAELIQSNIVTDASFNEAGNVEFNSDQLLSLANGNYITAVSKSPESDDKGGNLIISGGQIYFADSHFLADANAGRGGSIDITTRQFETVGNTSISVKSDLNLNGNIIINQVNLNNLPITLPKQLYEIKSLNECEPRKLSERSTFTTNLHTVSPQSPYAFYNLADKNLTQAQLLEKLQTNLSSSQRAIYFNDLANTLSIEQRQKQYYKNYSIDQWSAKLKTILNLNDYANLNKQLNRLVALESLHQTLTHFLYEQALYEMTDSVISKATIQFNQLRYQAETDAVSSFKFRQVSKQINKLPTSDKKIQLLLALYNIKPNANILKILKKLIGETSNNYLKSWIYLFLAEAKQDAKVNFSNAFFIGQKSRYAAELLYRLYWQRGKQNQQVADYKQAIEQLKQLRTFAQDNYLGTHQYFNELVEAVYFEYMALIFDEVEKSQTPHPPQLGELLEILADFKSIELNNYLQDCVSHVATTGRVAALPANTAVFYPIEFTESDRTALIVQIGNKLYSKTTASLGSYNQYETAAKDKDKLYEKLIVPIKPWLQQYQIDTLLIVPTDKLRTIPFAGLYDAENQKYLIEQYAITLLYQMPVEPLEKVSLAGQKILMAGLSEGFKIDRNNQWQSLGQTPLPSNVSRQYDRITGEYAFSALPQVVTEFEVLENLYRNSTRLFNPKFTAEQVDSEIRKTAYPIVHFATHASFAGHAENSFLLAYKEKIPLNHLHDLLSITQTREEQPIELLTLSACETAKGALYGDTEQLALGLAGVGLRTGARSVLATLWSVNDKKAALLIEEFYRQLQDPNMSKAKALQAAQLKLLKQAKASGEIEADDFTTWAAFVMIGNWL